MDSSCHQQVVLDGLPIPIGDGDGVLSLALDS